MADTITITSNVTDVSASSGVSSGYAVSVNATESVRIANTIVTGAKGDKGDTGATGPAGTTDHLLLSNIGTNTHAQIDTDLTRLAGTSNTNTGDETQATIKTKLGAATASVDGYATSTHIAKLDGIEAGAQVNTITSVAGKTGAVTLDKTDVGLSNVDNLAPADMPVSTATQAALNGKQNADPTLTALAAHNTNGILTQTAADTFTGRTITGTTNQITVTNGNGVAGNPTLALPQDIHTGASPTFAGGTLTGDLTLDSGDGISREINLVSGRPTDDIAGGTDGTSRINLYSYQRGHVNSFGENIRHYMMKKDAKSMDTYYFPSGGYDANGDPVGTMKPVVWHGAHWEANDHNSNHKHWSIETPDTTGAIQTRFEVRFGNPTDDSAIAGLDKTLIATNLADFVVRTSNGQMLRLSSPAGNHKPIEFNNDYAGSTAYRRWVIRSNSTAETGANAGNDFQIVNYDDSGTLLSQALHIQRSTGNVILGSSTPTAGVKLDINGGRVRIRTSTPPTSATAAGAAGEIAWDTNYFYVCVATNTWKRVAIATW